MGLFIGPDFGPDFKKDAPQLTWYSGSVVDVEVKYVINHAGNYQFRLCLDGSDTDECFKQTPLKFEDGQDWHWIDAGWMAAGEIVPLLTGKFMNDRIVIPDWVECDHCTLNWRWDTSLEASLFSNCADVSIKRRADHNLLTSAGLCLDLPGEIANGQPLWIWECNGHQNQEFIFAEGSWSITVGTDSAFCVDAGSDMNVGDQVFVWECNGQDQQVFGYDSGAGTIYLANSGSDASLCLKPESTGQAASVTLALCDNQDFAQHWGVSSYFAGLLSNQTSAELWVV